MMIATPLNRFDWQKLRLTSSEVRRMLVAGTAWGLAMSVGIAGMTFWKYAMVCPDDIVVTTVLSVTTGIFAIGPLAAYGRR
jgi:hypothetical protein